MWQQGTRLEKRTLLALMMAPFVGFILATWITQPIQFPDESGMIQNARFLSGTGSQSELWYRPGYSLLLIPVVLLTSNLGLVMVGVHLVNLGLAVLTGIGLFRLGQVLLPASERKHLVIAAAVTGLYPAYLYFAAFALADNLLIPAVIWSALWMARAIDSPNVRTMVATCVGISLTVAVHGRAIPLVLGAAAVLALQYRREPQSKLLIGLVTLVVGSLVTYLVSGMATDFNGATGMADNDRQGVGSLLSANLGLRPLLVLPFTMLGQLVYLVSATGGLVVLGAGRLSDLSIGDRTGIHLQSQTASRLLSVTGAASLLLAGLFTNQGVGDLAFYGRYIEVPAACLLFIGILVLLQGPPTWFRSAVPPVLLIAACVLTGVRGFDALDGRLERLNVTGASLPIEFAGRLDPIAISLFGCAVVLVVSLASKWRPVLGAATLAVVFVVSAAQLMYVTRGFVATVEERNELSALISQGNTGSCVSLDQSEVHGFWQGENYRIQNPETDFPYWRSIEAAESGKSPCGDLVISSRRDLQTTLPGWAPIAVEFDLPVWLWASPSAQVQLEQLPVAPVPGELIPELQADLEILDFRPSEEEADEYVALVRVANTSESTFVPLQNLPSTEGAIRVGLEWRHPDDPATRIHEPSRGDLLGLLRPGESMVVEVIVEIDFDHLVVEPGRWMIRVELVQEGFSWAEDQAATAKEVTVE